MSGCEPTVIVQVTQNQTVQQIAVTQTALREVDSAVEQVEQSTVNTISLDTQTLVDVEDQVRTIEVDVPGLPGPPGLNGSGTIAPINFSFGDAAAPVWVAPAAGLLNYARVSVDVAFDGTGAAIKVGTNSGAETVQPANFNDPTQIGDYENIPDVQLAAGAPVRLAITPGSGTTRGSGFLLLQFTPD